MYGPFNYNILSALLKILSSSRAHTKDTSFWKNKHWGRLRKLQRLCNKSSSNINGNSKTAWVTQLGSCQSGCVFNIHKSAGWEHAVSTWIGAAWVVTGQYRQQWALSLCRANQLGTGSKTTFHELEATEDGDLSEGKGVPGKVLVFLKQSQVVPPTHATEKLRAMPFLREAIKFYSSSACSSGLG